MFRVRQTHRFKAEDQLVLIGNEFNNKMKSLLTPGIRMLVLAYLSPVGWQSRQCAAHTTEATCFFWENRFINAKTIFADDFHVLFFSKFFGLMFLECPWKWFRNWYFEIYSGKYYLLCVNPFKPRYSFSLKYNYTKTLLAIPQSIAAKMIFFKFKSRFAMLNFDNFHNFILY